MHFLLMFLCNIILLIYFSIYSCLITKINAGIRVQSLKKGQIIMDIDFRWGGDPSIILGVEAALVASIPIQVGASITLNRGQIVLISLPSFESFHARLYLNSSIVHYVTVERS